MNLHDLQSAIADHALSTNRRTLRLRWSDPLHGDLAPLLLPQQAHVTEGVCEPTEARITCLSADARLPLHELPGQPFALQMLTDRGESRSLPLVVTQASLGRSDGGLTAVHLVGRDAMSLMDERRRLRCFHERSAVHVLNHVFGEWARETLFGCFTHCWLGVQAARHPVRASFIQHPDESDSGFAQRLLRAEGIGWFWRPCGQDVARPRPNRPGLPRQELVLFDESSVLPQAQPGVLRFHRRDGGAAADTVDLLSPQWSLSPAGAVLRSWDHESAQVQQAWVGAPWPGQCGAAAPASARVCMPHAGDSADDLARMARAQLDHQRQCAHVLLGRSGVRTLSPGTWQTMEDFPPFEGLDERQRSLTTLRVEHFALNNLPAELDLPAQALLGEPAWPAWARSGPAEALGWGTDARPPHRYANRFTAVPLAARIAPPPLLEHEQPRLRPLTGIVLAPGGTYVGTDELGRSRVQLLGGEEGADTTAWVRHRTPWAGEGVGLSTVLRPGTEVDIEWLAYDRPVIAGCHYNARTAPPQVARLPGLPHNYGQTALVSCELGGMRQQRLVLDDTPRQPMAQLASDAGHSALSLGRLATPRREGLAEPRGDGFELRSDDAGAIRTAKALLLSAWARLEAAGNQLSAEEHVALMQDCLELFKSLGRCAAAQHGLPVDDTAQAQLLADVQGAAGGSSVAPRQQGGAPTLNLTAPAGIAASTPKTILHCAGVNIDSVATQHLQWTAGQRLIANAGQGISLFAQQGISAIAQQGPFLMQSRHGDIEANAAGHVKWTATNGHLVGMARKVLLVAEDGSFLQLGEGGITLGTQGAITHKSASFAHTAPATMGADLPAFTREGADQQFVLRYGGPGGAPAAQRRFEIQMSDGSTVAGTSDTEGRTPVLQRDAMHIARIRILND